MQRWHFTYKCSIKREWCSHKLHLSRKTTVQSEDKVDSAHLLAKLVSKCVSFGLSDLVGKACQPVCRLELLSQVTLGCQLSTPCVTTLATRDGLLTFKNGTCHDKSTIVVYVAQAF